MTKYRIEVRDKFITNTDPQRRCYNGCNYSEEITFGEWREFQTWEGLEFTQAVVRGISSDRQEHRIVEVV